MARILECSKESVENWLRKRSRPRSRALRAIEVLKDHLQSGEPWVFKARVALAATLSGSYGIYNGFELLEHEAIPGKEEYLNSEKYELKVRDWDRPGNIKDYIACLNRIRRDNAALLQTNNLRFAQIDDNEVIGFIKESVARDNAVAVAVALTKAGPIPTRSMNPQTIANSGQVPVRKRQRGLGGNPKRLRLGQKSGTPPWVSASAAICMIQPNKIAIKTR